MSAGSVAQQGRSQSPLSCLDTRDLGTDLDLNLTESWVSAVKEPRGSSSWSVHGRISCSFVICGVCI